MSWARVAKQVFRMLGLLWLTVSVYAQTNAPVSEPASQLLEFSGKVEISMASSGNWRAASPGQVFHPGDKLRASLNSRATVRLSDKSVIRIDQNTLVEFLPPSHPAARRRFRLHWGDLFFLNREKPVDIEFETPLATGAIRGTEFFLAMAENLTTLALFDGAVELHSEAETLSLRSGQQALLKQGQRAVITAALPLRHLIQWTFYYPGVLNPADLEMAPAERSWLNNSLRVYSAGDLVNALALLPEDIQRGSDSVLAYQAALKLAVGRVDDAQLLLARLPKASPVAMALREVIAAVCFEEGPSETLLGGRPRTSSEWLAHSYYLQSRSRLPAALAAARRAAEIAPDFGFTWARVAELEFCFEHRIAARSALAKARALSPRNAEIFALEGFIALDERRARAALDSFDQATRLDSALANAWLGRGLAHELLRQFQEARRDIQTAAALEPQRSLFRSYLAKGFSQTHDDLLAEKDFRLAKQLDPADPTPWLYSALHDQQLNRLNQAVRELERSRELNDDRSVFRSRLLLDRDVALRNADLAAIYDGVGFGEVSRRAASQAVAADYANYSGHLFLARSLQIREDPNTYNLRYETPRQSELLVANLLAPAGGGNMSQLLSQQDQLQYFAQRPFGGSSFTEYGSRGDWDQLTTVFGTVGGLSYALDSQYFTHNGQRVNNDQEQNQDIATVKQQITPNDSLFFQAGFLQRWSGDVAQYYDPAMANRGFRVKEDQTPQVFAGYHHEWSPGSHTLVLVGHLRDQLTFHNPEPALLFFQQTGGVITRVQPVPDYDLHFQNQFALTSAEVQQIWENEYVGLIAGARYQQGTVDTASTLTPPLPPFTLNESIQPTLERADGYAYFQLRPVSSLQVTAGLSYDHLRFPSDADLPPLSNAEQTRSQLGPKVGLDYAPWRGGRFRAVYTRSLGGLYFDNSVRLEPAQLAGFTSAFRSLIPESVAGLVPGTAFETWGVGFDQVLPHGTYFGLEGEILKSNGERGVGALTNSLPIPLPDSPTVIRQVLHFHENSLSTYVSQLLGKRVAMSLSYRLSEAELDGQYPDLPAATAGLAAITQNERAVLGHLQLSTVYNHESGWYAQWHSDFYHQANFGYTPRRPDEAFLQHNIYVGYRFKHRRADARLGILNLTDQDYRLNPLNLLNDLPRARTLTASLRLNF